MRTIDEMDKLATFKVNFERLFKKEWDSKQLDAIICPAFQHCAFKSKNQLYIGGLNIYMALFNALDYPAGIVPVGEVKEGEEEGFDDGFNDKLTQV